jgi:hypothetical protein
MDNVYLVHITLPEFFHKKFYELISLQNSLVNQLLADRVVLSYSLDMERNNLWVFISASSEKAVKEILDTFPIIREVKVSIHELAFFDSAPVALPQLNLN